MKRGYQVPVVLRGEEGQPHHFYIRTLFFSFSNPYLLRYIIHVFFLFKLSNFGNLVVFVLFKSGYVRALNEILHVFMSSLLNYMFFLQQKNFNATHPCKKSICRILKNHEKLVILLENSTLQNSIAKIFLQLSSKTREIHSRSLLKNIDHIKTHSDKI